MPEGWVPNEDTRSHVLRAETYVKTTAMLNRVLGANWSMPLEQQWFWEFNHEDHKRRRVEKSWYRQMPSDDYEALLGENDKTYSQDTLNTISESLAKYEETGVYLSWEMASPSATSHRTRMCGMARIPAPTKDDEYQPAITGADGVDVCTLKHTKELGFDPLEKFLIYEEPQKDYDYAIGCDTGTEESVATEVQLLCLATEPEKTQIIKWRNLRLTQSQQTKFIYGLQLLLDIMADTTATDPDFASPKSASK